MFILKQKSLLILITYFSYSVSFRIINVRPRENSTVIKIFFGPQITVSKFPPVIEYFVQRIQSYYSTYVHEDLSRPPTFDKPVYTLSPEDQLFFNLSASTASIDNNDVTTVKTVTTSEKILEYEDINNGTESLFEIIKNSTDDNNSVENVNTAAIELEYEELDDTTETLFERPHPTYAYNSSYVYITPKTTTSKYDTNNFVEDTTKKIEPELELNITVNIKDQQSHETQTAIVKSANGSVIANANHAQKSSTSSGIVISPKTIFSTELSIRAAHTMRIIIIFASLISGLTITIDMCASAPVRTPKDILLFPAGVASSYSMVPYQSRGPFDFLGNWIQSSDWFPVEINVPDTISNIGSGFNTFAQNVGSGFQTFTQNVGNGFQNFAQNLSQRFPVFAVFVRPNAPPRYFMLVPTQNLKSSINNNNKYDKNENNIFNTFNNDILESFP